jgi:hypothetical protein
VGTETITVLQGFDTTAPTGTVSIEGDAAAVNAEAVVLYMTADDAVGVTEMCISNTATCSSWQPYEASPSWDLATGDGTKTVRVWFRDAAGNESGAASDTIVLDTTGPSDGALSITPASGQNDLAWTAASDALTGLVSYTLVSDTGAAPASCGDGLIVYEGADTTFTHTGLVDGTTYYYRVCATDAAGNTSTGATADATPAPDFDPPTGDVTIDPAETYTRSAAVTLTIGAADASTVTWMCVSNTASCSSWIAYAPTKAWTLSSGSGMKTVSVWLRDEWGNAMTSPATASIYLDTTAPTGGTLTATSGDAQATFAWSGFTDADSGVASYKIVFAAGSAPATCAVGTEVYAGTDTTYVHGGLTNGTTYGYRACAIDAAGNTSAGVTTTVRPVPESNAPVGSFVLDDGAVYTKNVTVNVAITASDESAITKMCLTNGTSCVAWKSYAATSAWLLTPGAGTRTVRLWLRDEWGNTSTAMTSSIVLDTIRPVGGALSAAAADAQVTLTWDGFSDQGTGLASYRVVFATGSTAPSTCAGGTEVYAGTAKTTVHSGLVNGATYSYRACAIDKAGNVSVGVTRTAKPAPELAPPTGGTVQINGGATYTKTGAVTLALGASDASGVTHMCITNALTCTAWKAFSETSAWNLSSGSGTKTVRAFFRDPWGNTSTAASDTIVLDGTAPAGGVLTATPGANRVSLAWAGFVDAHSGLASYKVVAANGVTAPATCALGALVYAGTGTSTAETGLTAGAARSYRVCAIDNVGNVSKGVTKTAIPTN